MAENGIDKVSRHRLYQLVPKGSKLVARTVGLHISATVTIMTQPNERQDMSFYYIDPSKYYTKTAPHPTQNLIEVYNLTAIADSVARLNDDGTKGVKLRKSYKAHISDLPGKHNYIPKERTISPIVFAPQEGPGRTIESFEPQMLAYNISFDKTPESGIPGFDAANLAIGDISQGTKRKSKTKGDDNTKRRRID